MQQYPPVSGEVWKFITGYEETDAEGEIIRVVDGVEPLNLVMEVGGFHGDKDEKRWYGRGRWHFIEIAGDIRNRWYIKWIVTMTQSKAEKTLIIDSILQSK